MKKKVILPKDLTPFQQYAITQIVTCGFLIMMYQFECQWKKKKPTAEGRAKYIIKEMRRAYCVNQITDKVRQKELIEGSPLTKEELAKSK